VLPNIDFEGNNYDYQTPRYYRDNPSFSKNLS